MKRNLVLISVLIWLSLLAISCKPEPSHGTLQLVQVKAGEIVLSTTDVTLEIPADAEFTISFSSALDTSTFTSFTSLLDPSGKDIPSVITYSADGTVATMNPLDNLNYLTSYTLSIGNKIRGINLEDFPGLQFSFKTTQGKLGLRNITLNGQAFLANKTQNDIDIRQISLVAEFSEPLDPQNALPFFTFSGGAQFTGSLSPDNKTVTFTNTSNLKDFTKYYFNISSNLTSKNGYAFSGFSGSFFTALDSIDKFPRISDEELIDLVQRQTFKYFWEFGHPDCGLARERNTSGNVVTIGGSGFGVMAMIAAMERGFINREQGLFRLDKILGFLETCDRFHGAWPHWLDGSTGKTVPFSPQDNGGDLVETSFMIQGLLTMREYLNSNIQLEKDLSDRITRLWETVEWTWYQNGLDVLFWHWSPNYFFNMNHQIRGHNETLITYVLAASSPTFPVKASAYHNGYAGNGSIKNGRKFFDIVLPLGWDYGGPLFFAHYSFMGLDPRNLSDTYANYWQQNVNHSLINMKYCQANPKGFVGYSADCWGLTASDNQSGYSAHSPTNDLGVITPTAALSSLPYTPEQSLKALRFFYYKLGDKLWGDYGFYDAFNISQGWWGDSYISIDQGPIIVMIENYRSSLLWALFMKSEEVRAGLIKLGFTF